MATGDNFEWTELDRLTAHLRQLVNRHEQAPRARTGLLRQIESEIGRIEAQRERLVTNLTRRLITQVAA
ncbi:MAG: hypothetical protein JO058_06345 [Alphaproteobacteria bacterium]|nr:hypothetical protein [Alphaproteobacteria bacterium]